MIRYFYSTAEEPDIQPIEAMRSGSWLRCERPAENEIALLIELGLDEDIIADALDPHEVPRVEIDDDWAYLIARLPDTDDDFNDFTTPILFCFNKDQIVTVSRDNLNRLWQPFIDRSPAPTTQRTQLLTRMLETLAQQYQRRVATINRQMRAATSDVRTLRSRDIATLATYERRLNDYLDALIPTNLAVEKLFNSRALRMREDDRDEFENLSTDLEQVIARCKSLLRTITNVRDSYRAVMNARLNETIQLLTVLTVALTIPTMIAGLFGMNVELPFSDNEPAIFWEIVGVSLLCASILAYYFLRKRS